MAAPDGGAPATKAQSQALDLARAESGAAGRGRLRGGRDAESLLTLPDMAKTVVRNLILGLGESNALNATAPLPKFYWTGDTEMRCVRKVIRQTLEYGYAHHIQRLMVTGLFTLLLGVRPQAVHEWYLAAYVDAVEWVELPNTLGMSQFGDGGLMASKP